MSILHRVAADSRLVEEARYYLAQISLVLIGNEPNSLELRQAVERAGLLNIRLSELLDEVYRKETGS